MKRLLLFCILAISLSSASLINTTDQTNNDDYALGGNSASSAYFKSTGFEGGLTMFNLFGQSKSILDNHGLAGTIGGVTGKTEPANMFTNLFAQYTFALNNDNWVCVGYSNDSSPVELNKQKQKDTTNTATLLNDAGAESLYATYSYDAGKFLRGLYVGAELAFNKDFDRKFKKVSNSLKDALDYDKTSVTLTTSTPWYTSLAFSGIYDMGKLGMITAAQKFYGAKNWDISGQKDLDGEKVDNQWNEETPAETSLAYIYSLTKDISVAGSYTTFWNKTYTETASKSKTGDYTETEVNILGYNKYTLWGEYTGFKGLNLQGYYGWAKNVGVYTTDADGAYSMGSDETYMGANGSMTFGEHTVLVGLARTMSLGREAKDLTDETKMYVNYGYAF